MDPASIHHFIEICLTWIGFGVVCGIAAKLIMPGRDPGGTIVTFSLGMGGALIGGATYAWGVGHRIKDMISPLGFGVAIGGALILLASHRLLSGRLFPRSGPLIEEIIVPEPHLTRRRRRATRLSDLD